MTAAIMQLFLISKPANICILLGQKNEQDAQAEYTDYSDLLIQAHLQVFDKTSG